MAAPNLAAPTTITGKLAYVSPANTSETTLLTNAASSGLALRVTSLLAANTSASAADITVTVYSAASGGTGYKIANTVTVPAKATIVILGRDSSIWLEEDRRITVTLGTSSAITVTCGYEQVA